MHKNCPKCGEAKEINLFKYQSGAIDKHSKICKTCLIKNKNKIASLTIREDKWTLQNVKNGFARFYKENTHFPSAPEIDNYAYLPSSRQIQRKFGGLIKFRTEFGLTGDEVDKSRGGARRNSASATNIASLSSERTVLNFLNSVYGEICVHEQKKYGEGKNTVDFFVYGKLCNFGVEVFNTYTLRNISINLNIKLPKYYDFPYRLCFVVTGGDFKQDHIDRLISKKHIPLLTNMSCMIYDKFKNECIKITPPLEINTVYNKTSSNQDSMTVKS